MTQMVKRPNCKPNGSVALSVVTWIAGIFVCLLVSSNPLHAEVKVQIAPAKVILFPEKLQTFTPTVTGADNNAVRWSRSPELGVINQETGEYTAPKYTGCEKIAIKVTATSIADNSASASATVELPPAPTSIDDCRENFEGSFYLGLAIDTFATGETRKYLNPDDANRTAERGIGGFDFSYRVWRSNPELGKQQRQFWVYGETVHGVRSADVDCSKEENHQFALCKNDPDVPDVIVNPTKDLLKIVRNASSLEAFAGVRYEFHTLNRGGSDVANLYVKAQAGFLKVSHVPGDATDMHHIGFGALATKGNFQGSYLEFGIGRNDLFAPQGIGSKGAWNRKRFDG